MSLVFLAHEEGLDRQVVIKVLPADLMAGVNIDRFRREIQLAAQLQQANIVPVLAAGEAGGIPYYVMPFVDGKSLRDRLDLGRMPIAEIVSILRDVARALATAHAAGVVHRDIKPENILISGGTAVVTDFGIARAISAARAPSDSAQRDSAERLTRVGTSVGTPAYMAPEQAAGDPDTDFRADIYALGVVAYEMLTSTPLFSGKSAQELVVAHLTVIPPPVLGRRPDVPPALADLVMQCLEKSPDARPANAQALLTRLDGITGEQITPAVRRRTLAMYGLIFAATVLVARLAMSLIGLPSWVFPATVVVLALGLPAVLLLPRQRALRTGAIAIATLALVVTGYMTLRALGIRPMGSLVGKGVMKPRDAVLLATFRSTGIDSTIAPAVSEALRSGLTQSSSIIIASDDIIATTLRRMRRDSIKTLDLATARDVALRIHVPVVIDGSVTPVGTGYLVTVRMVTASQGEEVASFHESVANAGGLINAVDNISRQLRAKVGESLKRVQETPELYYQTTSSIEALKEFSRAIELGRSGKFEPAATLLESAVKRDSLFGMAWNNLAGTYRNIGRGAAADSAQRRAFALRDRLSEWERLYVTGIYYGFPRQRDPVKAAAAFQELVDRGDSGSPMRNLATLYLNQRQYARAEPLLLAAQRQDSQPMGRMNLVPTLFNQGKTREAQAQLDTMRKALPKYRMLLRWQAELAYQRGDIAGMAALADSAWKSDGPFASLWGIGRLAELAMMRGQLKEYERYYGQANATQVALGNHPSAANDSLIFTFRDLMMSADPARALGRLDMAIRGTTLDTTDDPDAYFLIVRAYAMGNRPERARAILAEYDRQPWDSVQRRLDTPGRHLANAEILLAEKKWRDAIAEFRKSDTAATGVPAGTCRTCLYAELGRAFDLAGMADSAIVNLELYLNTPYFLRMSGGGITGISDAWLLAPTLRRLGELHEQRGNVVQAAKYYRRFLDLWKDADPQFQSVVAQVRDRLKKLGSGAG